MNKKKKRKDDAAQKKIKKKADSSQQNVSKHVRRCALVNFTAGIIRVSRGSFYSGL